MSTDKAFYKIQANNDMFWTNLCIGPMYHKYRRHTPELTLELRDKPAGRFQIIGLDLSQTSCTVQFQSDNEKYLQWSVWTDSPHQNEHGEAVEYAAIRESTTKPADFLLTPTTKNGVTTFTLQTPDKKFNFRREYWTVEYIAGASEVDTRGVFRLIQD